MVTAARRVQPRAAAGGVKSTPTSSGYHGAEGRRRMEEEEERNAARREAAQMNSNMPFRFFCPVGETREVVIVDAEPNFFRFEHNMKDTRSNKWTVFCACINENANCPVCKATDRPSYYAMYLTVIDLTPYESEKHGTVEWSKKLLVVKSQQQKKITRFWERHGTLRGMVLSMTRDGDKDAAIGNDIEFIEFMEEDELLTYETVYEYERDGKRQEKEILGHETFDYDELFPMPTEQQLRAIVGGRAEPGSREEADSAVGRRGATSSRRGDDFDAPRTPARTRPAGRTAVQEDAANDDPPPETTTRRRAAPEPEPARRAAGIAARRPLREVARREPEPDTDGAEEVQDEPQPRTARAPLRTAGRRAEPPVDDDPPQRSASSLADRRRQLRR